MINKTSVAIFLKLLLISTLYLPNTFAQYQDYMQLNLPEGAKARFGKGGGRGNIAYSPDGTQLAVSNGLGIWIYDANTLDEVTLFTGHTGGVNSVVFSPDGEILVSGGDDNTIRVWNVHTGQLLHTLDEHTGSVNSVAFSPDGKMFASGSSDFTARLWDADTHQLLKTFRMVSKNTVFYVGTARVYSVAFSPDGKTLATGDAYRHLELWDINAGKLLVDTNKSRGTVTSVAFSSDGDTLASGDTNGQIQLWGARTGKYWQTVGEHNRSVNSVTFSPDGKTLASGGDDSKIKLWDAFTGEHLHTLEGHKRRVYSVAFSPDGSTLASGAGDGTIRLWDVNTWKEIHKRTAYTGPVTSLAFSPDEITLATGVYAINLWDFTTGQFKDSFSGHKYRSSCISFSPDGTILASGSYNNWGTSDSVGTIIIGDIDTGKQKLTSWGHRGGVNSVAFSPDGTTLVSGGGDGRIYFWDVNTGEHKQTIKDPRSNAVNSVSFSPDGQTLVSASFGQFNGGIYLFHVPTGRRLKTLVSALWLYSVTFSPDGSIIAGGVGDEIRLWNPRSGERLLTLTGHTVHVRYVLFSPNGKMLASVGNREIRLWDVGTGEHLDSLWGHTNSVNGVSFSPDGTTLASGSWDGTILLWDLAPSHITGDTPSTPTTSDATVSISATEVQSPTIGELLTFPLNITDGENVAGYQATVEFDTTALRYVSSENGDYLPHGAFFVPPVVEENKVTLAASSLASESNGDGTLATLTFELVAAKTSTLKLSEVSLVDSDGVRSYPNIEENTQIEIIEAPYAPEDVNEDGVVNVLDLVAVASNFGQTGENIADVNEDGVVDIVDLVLVAGALGSDAAAPSVWDHDLEVGLTHADVQQWLTQARGLDLTDVAQKGIIFLEQLLEILTPTETTLLPNYPNPFNPETWIPYQLAEPADVSISIYSADGKLIRTLDLGHQPIGIYESRSRAAYWDGKNAIGEPVASGVYFYTLTARDFIATRKMLIMK